MRPSGESDDTVDLARVEAEDGNSKKCCQCGKDLRGHRRFKDSVGYWCKDCHRVDKKRNTIPEGRCPDCGRMRPLDKLFQTDDGMQVCSQCLKEREVQKEKRAVKMGQELAEKSGERRQLYILLGVLVLVGVVVLVQQLMRLMGHR